mmetsp:Transcript_93384/g.301866  ORF Transcript_93384/g.301866 Transcript_93384/m.301866 type:complete len:228 (+) Transcript_93384:695-1378(+)
MRSTTSSLSSQRRVFCSLSWTQGSSLQILCSSRSWSAAAGQWPPPSASSSTFRLRSSRPPPQAREQLDQSVQSPSVQSSAQGSMPHSSEAAVCPQGSPPRLGKTATSRVRSRTPPPHSAVQPLQPPQSPKTQSTGHDSSLHGRTISRGGQAAPRWGCTRTLLKSLRLPPPQVAEHSSGVQGETSQSTGGGSSPPPCRSSSSPRTFRSPQSWRSISRTLAWQPRMAAW